MSNSNDETIHNFMLLTNTADRDVALKYLNVTSNLEEAVNLYFTSEDTGAHKFDESPPQHFSPSIPHPSGYGDPFSHRGAAPQVHFDDEEKLFMQKQNKIHELESQYNSKFSGIFNNITKKFFGSKETMSGKDFSNANPKFPLAVAPFNLEDCIKYFPFMANKRNLLAVYVQRSTYDGLKNQALEKAIFEDKNVSTWLAERALFTAVADNHPQVESLKPFSILKKDAPCLVFFTYNLYYDVIPVSVISLEPLIAKKLTIKDVIGQIKEGFEKYEKLQKETNNFRQKIITKQQLLQRAQDPFEHEAANAKLIEKLK